jgi:BirA family biotin operon repressor/biotin-[acetyl-CoA-carboxylase] ligase
MGLVLIRTVAETGSTNDDLAALAREGAPEGTWLRAERQTGGKGRQGRAWLSPPGNLYISTLVRLRPADPPAPTLALLAAVALHETVALQASGVAIKWPNDLTAIPPRNGEGDHAKHGGGVGAKLAGILLERHGEAVVIGMGVNLAFAPDLPDRPAISLADLSGTPQNPAAFAEILAETFARWLARWRAEGLAPVRKAWLAAAHPIGTALSTSEGQGLFDGLDEDGALRLRLADGTTRVIHAGDVFLI